MATASVLRFDRSAVRRVGRDPVYADAAEVARTLAPESPVFCFSAETLRRTARDFLTGFPGEVAFAVKSNASRVVLETLASAGIRVWDVASVREMATVRAIQPDAAFHYHNPVKSRAEIGEAFGRYGCRRFAADSVEELDKIAALAADPARVEIAVRFVLPRASDSTAHDFSTKFGLDESGATALLADVAARGFKPVLTFHPGSQCKDPRAYARHIAAAARIALGTELHALNVGGGFPARYATSAGAERGAFFAAIEEAARVAFAGRPPKLECEPGRGLVANCVSLLTRVKIVRGARMDLFINDGVYGALMEVSQVPELMPPLRVIRNGAVLDGATAEFTVYGPTCDPLDRLPGTIRLPADIAEDDFIDFGTLGAYGFATMTEFNGYGGHETVRVRRALAC